MSNPFDNDWWNRLRDHHNAFFRSLREQHDKLYRAMKFHARRADEGLAERKLSREEKAVDVFIGPEIQALEPSAQEKATARFLDGQLAAHLDAWIEAAFRKKDKPS